MEIIWSQAIFAGVFGAALMALAMFAGRIMGLSTDLVSLLGLFFVSREQSKAVRYSLGMALHLLVGAGYGVIYALLLTSVGVAPDPGAAAIWGILFGVLHGVLIGAGAGLLPLVHPRMGGPEGVMDSPGFFGRNIGVAMPVALILLHVIYGVSAALIYTA